MPPALTAKCPHEPFSKPRRINPRYTHDSSGHVLFEHHELFFTLLSL